MSTHKLQLATVPFDAILSAIKPLNLDFTTKKRQTIQLGDIIIFTNRENMTRLSR